MSIFRDNAPLYWAAGIPVMPLKRWNSLGKGAGKAPILNEWTQYGEYMPSEAVRSLWLGSYPDSNIGLPFGPASGLCAIDIDTEDQKQVDAILGALPPSPWKRVGKKGMGLVYRWNEQTNFKLRDGDNNSIVEFLGKGNQMVLPPSIHPDTQRPYVSDTNLYEVLDHIQSLPLDIEAILRRALGQIEGLSIAQTARSTPLSVVPQGERDIQMVRHAGYLARVVLGIDKTTRFSLSEAMKHMAHWVENFTAHTAGGDDMDPDKGVSKLIEFLLKDLEGGRTMPSGWDKDLTDEQRDHPAIAKMIELNTSQRWDGDKALEWLSANLSAKPTGNEVSTRIYEIISLVAKDEHFTEMDLGRMISTMQEIASPFFKLGKPDIKAYFKKERAGDRELAEDHEAIARQVIDEMERGGELRFDQGNFWQWGGAHFVRLEEDVIYVKVAETVKGNQLVRRHNDYLAICKTIAKLISKPLVVQLEDGINFANGFLDANLELQEHSPKYGKTFTMPFNYIPERATEAHKFFEFLEKCWGDDADYTEKMMAMQEAIAATMFGVAPKYQCAILLFGQAKTGKSVMLEVLQAMMPPDAKSSVTPTNWAQRFQLAPMVGKALNICGELPEEATIDGRAFKEIIEGTVQNTELKGGAIFQFKPTAAQWFASNFLPRSRDTSKGFTRRWLILEFNRVVPDSERIVDYHQVLVAEEREAIAAWAVQGLKRLMQNSGYTKPASHEKRLNQVTRANNSVAAFIQSSDKVVRNPDAKADTRNVFDHYCEYMRTISRGFGVSFERFIQMLDEQDLECVPYMDGVGAQVYETKGLELKQALLPKRLT